MTERLYYDDCYLRSFHASVLETADEGRRVYLDRTAFYPTSGGQPFDLGSLGGVKVVDVVDEGDRIAHVIAAPAPAGTVECHLDWVRRHDHMQQHTGQHLLSAVIIELFGIQTVSFHLSQDVSTIDLDTPALSGEQVIAAERRANEIVFENRPVSITYQQSVDADGLRKASEREGVLRIVTIEALDRSACGGTHTRTTGEIGPVLLRKLDKMRGGVRIEFVCGMRAIRRARLDYEALARIARSLSSSLDDAPAVVAAQSEKANELEKARRKLATEVAEFKGRELYASTAPGADGIRRVIRRHPVDDDARTLAQSFAAGSKAIFLATGDNAMLLVASSDAGIHAGNTLRAVLSAVGGRGGGNAQVAQGSAPTVEALEKAVAELTARVAPPEA